MDSSNYTCMGGWVDGGLEAVFLIYSYRLGSVHFHLHHCLIIINHVRLDVQLCVYKTGEVTLYRPRE